MTKRSLKDDHHWLRAHIADVDLKTVLENLTLSQRWMLCNSFHDDNHGFGPRHIAMELSYCEATYHLNYVERTVVAKSDLQHLKREGCLEFGCLQAEDQSYLQGRGYWLSGFGARVKFQIEQGYFN